MRNRQYSCLAILFLLFFAACGKKEFNIGRENPEQEIQKCIKLSDKKKYEESIECLEIFKSRFAETSYGQEAELRIADNYFKQKEYLLAADTYQMFLKLYPIHSKADYASFRTGLSYLKEAPKAIDRDQTYLKSAIEHLEYAVRNFPKSQYADETKLSLKQAKERVAKREFYVGRFYYRTGEYLAAITRFQRIDEKYSGTPVHAKSLYYWYRSDLKLNNKEEASRVLTKLQLNYPDDKLTRKAAKKVKN